MDTSDVISVVALVVSLIAGGIATWVGHQSSTRAYESSVYQGSTALALEIDRLLVDHPDYGPYLFEAKSLDPTAPDRYKVLGATMMVLDVMEGVWKHQEEFTGRHGQQERAAWLQWAVALFESSPVLADLYLENREWYPNVRALHREAGTRWQ